MQTHTHGATHLHQEARDLVVRRCGRLQRRLPLHQPPLQRIQRLRLLAQLQARKVQLGL